MKLVGAQREEVHAKGLDVDGQLAGHLDGVRVAQHALAAANRGHLLDGEQDPGLVVGVHHRNDGRVGPDGLFENVQVQRAVGLDGQVGDVVAVLLEVLPELDVGGVLDLGGDDVTLAGGVEGRLDGGVVRLGAAACERDLLGVRVHQGRHPFTGRLHVPMHARAEAVGARRVAPVVAKERDHGVHDLGCDPCGGVVVEIIDLLLLHSVCAGNQTKPLRKATDGARSRKQGLRDAVHPEVVGDRGAGCRERTGPAWREHGGADVDVRAPSVGPATTSLGTPTTSGCILRDERRPMPGQPRSRREAPAPSQLGERLCHRRIPGPMAAK